LLEFYGLELPYPAEHLSRRSSRTSLGRGAMPGDFMRAGEWVLVVREVSEGRVERVGLEIVGDSPEAP
jgi:hypothetical protein